MWNSDKDEHRTAIQVGEQYCFPMYASLIKHDDSWYMAEVKAYDNIDTDDHYAMYDISDCLGDGPYSDAELGDD